MGQIRVLAKLEGGRERERELHAQFKADRLKKNTRMSEWFRMSDDLCCFIPLPAKTPCFSLWDVGGCCV